MRTDRRSNVDHNEATLTSESSNVGSAQRGRLRVLIVDDPVDAADRLALLLHRLGYEVQATNDDASALTVAA